MPSLRHRQDDIPLLLEHFVKEFAQRYQREVTGFDEVSVEHLQNYDWPGNIRELRNLVERSIALADGPLLHLEQELMQHTDRQGIDSDNPSLELLEKRYILKILDRCSGNREQTAEILGINKSTLWRKLQSWQKQSVDAKENAK